MSPPDPLRVNDQVETAEHLPDMVKQPRKATAWKIINGKPMSPVESTEDNVQDNLEQPQKPTDWVAIYGKPISLIHVGGTEEKKSPQKQEEDEVKPDKKQKKKNRKKKNKINHKLKKSFVL